MNNNTCVPFFQNYEGDVSDLELVFAFDEEILGQVGQVVYSL